MLNPSLETCIAMEQIYHKYPSGFEFNCDKLNIPSGSCSAIIGHNGAGKSTCFNMLTLNMDGFTGKLFYLGERVDYKSFQIKKKIGYLPQNIKLADWSNAQDLLSYAACLHEITEPNTALKQSMEYWDCLSYANSPLATCSHGMKKRVALAMATLHDPELLILDEPFSGLDIKHMKTLEKYIQQRTQRGKTTVLSTHIFYYVAKLCPSNVWLIEQGHCRKLDNWDQVTANEKVTWLENQILSQNT